LYRCRVADVVAELIAEVVTSATAIADAPRGIADIQQRKTPIL
jgi:hypothetical protein